MQRLLVVAGLLGIAVSVHAGVKIDSPVTVNTAARIASGDLGTARNSADTSQSINCFTDVQTGVLTSGFCLAFDSAGHVGVCVTQSANFVDQIRSLTGDAFITFRWDASSNCTEILIDNASYTPPKVR
jgi:hypothetical protein